MLELGIKGVGMVYLYHSQRFAALLSGRVLSCLRPK